MKKAIHLLLALLFYAQSANATTFYVRTGGSDAHNCTQAQTDTDDTAKKTITAGLACAGAAGTDDGAGHTVQVANGTYVEQLINKIPNGSANGALRFTLKAANIRGATLRPTVGNPIIDLDNTVHYINLDGFVLDGTGYTGSTDPQDGLAFSTTDFTTVHDIKVTNMEIHHVPDNAISFSGGVSIEISHNYTHDTGTERSGGGTGLAHGCYCPLKDSAIFANTFDSAKGYGWHPNTVSAGHPSGQDHLSENTDVYGNIFSNNGFGGLQWGALIAGRNIKFYNNLLYGNFAAIIVGHFVAPVTDGNFIYNNSIYNNAHDYGAILLQGQSNTIIKNSIITTSNRPWDNSFETPTVFTNNICDQSIAGCTNANPLWVNAGAGDFNLQAGSPATGAGADLSAVFTTDYAGNTWTVPWGSGAYKFVTPGTPIVTKLPSSPTALRLGAGASLNVGLTP